MVQRASKHQCYLLQTRISQANQKHQRNFFFEQFEALESTRTCNINRIRRKLCLKQLQSMLEVQSKMAVISMPEETVVG